jgi:hypothetical protein
MRATTNLRRIAAIESVRGVKAATAGANSLGVVVCLASVVLDGKLIFERPTAKKTKSDDGDLRRAGPMDCPAGREPRTRDRIRSMFISSRLMDMANSARN